MVVRILTMTVAVWVGTAPARPVSAQLAGGPQDAGQTMDARIWLDRGAEPVLQTGERVRIYYRVSGDAHVAVFHIDTDGTVRLVFPRSPDETHLVMGGRDYRILFPETSYWFVEEDPGMGYFFLVASPVGLDLSRFSYSYYDGGWDLSSVGRQVYSDPYEAMDDYVAALLPDWETVPYGLDFTTYHVGGTQAYPRFLCYDCHGYTPYAAWNPYAYTCSSFRVVIYDDPYYYPSYRYGPGAVVYPSGSYPARFAFKERADGEPAGPLVTSRDPGGWTGGAPGRPEPGARSVPTDRIDPFGVEDGRRRLPVTVPWPRSVRPPATGGPGDPRGVPLVAPDDARARPRLEPRTPRRRPSGELIRRDPGRDDATPAARPSGTNRASPNGPGRSGGPAARPPGGARSGGPAARPSGPQRSGGPAARPPSSRPPAPPRSTPPKRRRGGGGAAGSTHAPA